MSDATPSTTIQEQMKSVLNEANTDPGERLKDDFVELVHDLEPYVFEHLWEPTFHEFPDLPIELRDKIYEKHFLDNRGCLTTHTWSLLDWSRVSFDS